jgi:ATP-dependent exoDNAse (exonuclease V) beta subunit
VTADQQERERALDPSQSFIVEAPAGSGKTGLLAQRYLRLLSIVERPESIIAMTFTRKAAAEMRERIHAALLAAQNGTPVSGEHERRTRELSLKALARDREKSWHLLVDTGRLQIQTIDSLCAMLARQMPVVSGFGGVRDIVEDAREFYRLAARRAIRQLAEGNEEERGLFCRASLHFDSNLGLLERQIAEMLEQRDQWSHLIVCDSDTLVEEFSELLNRGHAALLEVFRERSIVDFTELNRAAIAALGSAEHPSDLLYRLDYRIEHLLVDEFQDTSHAQYDLISQLTGQWSDGDGHTLFVVGDPMQSIYRFRGAEVSLFLQSWRDERLGAVRLNRISLNTNFRSTPEVLAWVQEKFAPIMSEDNGGAVKFRPSVASRPSGGARPQLVALIDDKSGDAEASVLVKIAEQELRSGTVAILVRSRAHIARILPALRAAEIRYEAVEIDELQSQQHVIDLLSLARAISHPADRPGWLACLRAPWCGLTLGDLAALAENQPDRAIFDLLSDADRIAGLSPEGRLRAVRFQEIISPAVAQAGRTSLRELVERTWLALGGPAALAAENQQDDVDTFLDLLEQAEQGGVIRDFTALESRLEFLYAKPASSSSCVQVMTVHQAKGLEFDTVIIPHLAGGARSSDHDLLIWTEIPEEGGSSRLSIAAQPPKRVKDPRYEAVNKEIQQRELHELKRLFYVACTRAKNALYVIGNANANKKGDGLHKPGSATFLGLIWSVVEDEYRSALRRRVVAPNQHSANGQNAVKTILNRLPAGWQPPRLERSVHWEPGLQRATASVRKITYEWVSDTSRHVGTVVHEFLKRVAQSAPAAWDDNRLGAISGTVRSELLRLGVPPAETPKAESQVLRAITNTLRSARGRWILQQHAEACSEAPLTGRIQDQLVNGAIDRMFRDEQGRLWIIDYKTSEHQGSRLERFLNEEQRRYRPQLESYALLMSRMVSGPISLGLYFPLLDAWREWEFEEERAVVGSYTGE